MKNTWSSLLFISLLSCSVDGESKSGLIEKQILTKESKPLECGLYLAPSTIPGAGLGLFAGHQAWEEGTKAGYGDICIPIVNPHLHRNYSKPFFHPLGDYTWSHIDVGMTLEACPAVHLEAFCPGIDALVNSHQFVLNLGSPNKSHVAQYLPAGIFRTSPNAGAVSPYRNSTTRVSRRIPPGGELFKSYGPTWFPSRAKALGDSFAFPEDFRRGQALLNRMAPLVDRISSTVSVSPLFTDLFDIVQAVTGTFQSRILKTLPREPQHAHDAGDDESGLLRFHEDMSRHSLEYLTSYGQCVDHVRPVPLSPTHPEAGQGAVAARDLPQGTIVSTSPLHVFPDLDYFNMYVLKQNDKGTWERESDHVHTKQLLLNYCFGHPNTTMTLCPYGPGVNYINHDRNPNVRIRWSLNPWHNATAVAERTVENSFDFQLKLAFDYVALRNISEGEEILLDYGDAWETAWKEHKRTYQPIDGKIIQPDYVYNHQLHIPLRTRSEQEFDPYPEHLHTRCHVALLQPTYRQSQYNWLETPESPLLVNYGLPCHVLQRYASEMDPSEYAYTVELDLEILSDEHKADLSIPKNDLVLERHQVPRRGVAQFTRPNLSDMHLSNTFRHSIGLPDSVLPLQWKNAI
jgi:hypothetical protein